MLVICLIMFWILQLIKYNVFNQKCNFSNAINSSHHLSTYKSIEFEKNWAFISSQCVTKHFVVSTKLYYQRCCGFHTHRHKIKVQRQSYKSIKNKDLHFLVSMNQNFLVDVINLAMILNSLQLLNALLYSLLTCSMNVSRNVLILT